MLEGDRRSALGEAPQPEGRSGYRGISDLQSIPQGKWRSPEASSKTERLELSPVPLGWAC